MINEGITYPIPLPTKYEIRYVISPLILSHAISDQPNMTLGFLSCLKFLVSINFLVVHIAIIFEVGRILT